jgi:hypothetical protein
LSALVTTSTLYLSAGGFAADARAGAQSAKLAKIRVAKLHARPACPLIEVLSFSRVMREVPFATYQAGQIRTYCLPGSAKLLA